MSFDFDKFVNGPSMQLFGVACKYRPKHGKPFALHGDFHESYMDINLVNAGADISAAKTVVFVRLAEFPVGYQKPKAGDYISVGDLDFQILNIEPHIPGSIKLVLHDAS